nr:protein stu1 [Quercus suber]
MATMDQQAATLLATLKRPAAPSEAKNNLLKEVKSSIKHYRVPDTAVGPLFECLRLAIVQQASSILVDSALSTLGHLIKRLKIQDPAGSAIAQLAPRLLPALQDRLGDLREPIRASVSQGLSELYPFLATDVETLVRDETIPSGNPRAKEAAMQWVVRMHREDAMPFKTYVAPMVARLEDADGTVREAAKTALIELFINAPDRAKTDLKKQLKAHSVRHATETHILAEIGVVAAPRPTTTTTAKAPEREAEMISSTRSLPSIDHMAQLAETINSEAAQPPPQEVIQMDPLYVHSSRELEDTFRDMLPAFEGKESEQNWIPRDKSVLKIRRLLKGNAPNEYHQVFMAGIKSVSDGILKVANSLRTTVSTNGCQLVQELAQTLGPALDPHVEIFLQSFIKTTATTKLIAAQNGRTTASAIFQNCTYHVRMMQHIWTAAQEKNKQTRQCAPDWLKIILKRQASYKTHFESSGGLDLAEKCFKKLLDDADPKVKEGMRAIFWSFAKTWPDRANQIMSKLDPKSKAALEKDSHNPNATFHTSVASVAVPSLRSTGTNSRAALREMMAEQKRKAKTGQVPERPNSAMAAITPAKPRMGATISHRAPSNLSHSTRADTRVPSAASMVSQGTPSEPAGTKRSALMSGPVRRPRKPEIARPQTADPYAARRMVRPETPASNGSPVTSPQKGTVDSRLSSLSASRDRARTAGNLAVSPVGSPTKRSPRMENGHPAANSSRPSSKHSNATHGEDLSIVREDDFTMILPHHKASTTSDRAVLASAQNRSGHGHTVSVDSGIPAMAEDDGFTMVIPTIPNQPRASSPLAYRNPMKTMFDEARDMLDKSHGDHALHASVNGIDTAIDGGGSRRGSPIRSTPLPETVQIYEDPFTADAAEAPTSGERQVLGELPVNENMRMQSPIRTSPADSPQRLALNAQDSTEDHAEVLRNRRLLGSGIDRIRAKTLDAHGFRRVQDIAKSDADIWEGGRKYDELMGVLLEYLQTFDADAKLAQQSASKTTGLKTQAVGLVRALLNLYKKAAAPWHARVLVTLLVCRRFVDGTTHLLADLERAADDVLAAPVSPESCIDAIVRHLPHASAPPALAMALHLLRRLLAPTPTRAPLPAPLKLRITRAVAALLDHPDAHVRKADVELASELFDLFGTSKADFWAEFKGTTEGRLGLLTYYIARRGNAQAPVAAA